MRTWDLTNEDDLIALTHKHNRLTVKLIASEVRRGEILPHPARREMLARFFGLTPETLMEAVSRGCQLIHERMMAEMTEEERRQHEEWSASLGPVIEEVVADMDRRQQEINDLNQLFEL